MKTLLSQKKYSQISDDVLTLLIKRKVYLLEGNWHIDETLAAEVYSSVGLPVSYDYLVNIADTNWLIYPDDLFSFLHRIEINDQPDTDFEFRILSAAGEVRTLRGAGHFVEFSETSHEVGNGIVRREEEHDLKNAEHRLSDTYNLMESIIQSDIVALSVLKPIVNVEGEVIDFEWVMANKLLKAMASGRDVVGKRFTVVFPALEANGVLDILKEVIVSGIRRTNEFFYRDSNVKGWFRAAYVRANDYVIVTAEDITTAKKAEFELKASRRKLEAAFNVAGTSLFILRSKRAADGKVTDFIFDFVNTSAVHCVGYDPSGLSFLSVFPAFREATLFTRLIEPFTLDDQVQFETEHERNNERLWLNWKAVKLDDGLFVSAEDITERRESADALLRNYNILQQTEAVAGIGSWEFVVSTEKLHCSSGITTIYGLTESTHLSIERYREFAVYEDKPIADRIISFFQQNPAGFDETIRIKVNGKSKTIKTKGTVLYDEHGKATKILGVDCDITALVETVRLKEMNSKLKELDRAKTKFFSNVSHELRTPLTLILAPIGDMLKNPGNTGSASDYGRLEMVYRNSLRLQKLVNTLLDFSRIEAGRLEAFFQPVDFSRVTTEIASLFRSGIEHAGLKFIVRGHAVSEPVYINREMWEKVVLNLISNAFKFTLHGKISVSLHERRKFVMLKVKDTGVGISNKHIPRIFERFTRIEGVNARTHEGSGIGLALVKELVAMHGGTIKVKSKEGEGSEFIVSIPKGKSHLPAKQVFESSDQLPSEHTAAAFTEEALGWLPEARRKNGSQNNSTKNTAPTVLFADDNSDMRRYMENVLGGEYKVVLAEHGERVVELLRNGLRPDLIVADVMMPKMDGFELTNFLKGEKHYQHIPVILLSARAGEEAKIEGMEFGADDYLTKPFSSKELMALVRSRIQVAQMRNAAEAKLKLYNTELESRVAERTQMLEESKALVTTQNRHLKEILDAIPQMVWVLDAEGKITSVNERWHDYTGITEHQCANLDHQRCDIFHPSQQEELATIWTEASEKLTGFTREILIREHTGNYRWHLGILEPVLDDNKKVVMWVGTFTNVHEEFILEQEIKEAKELLEAVFNASFDTISILHSVFDDDGKVVDFEWVMANEKMRELAGRSDLAGKTIRSELPKNVVEVLLPRFQEVIQSSLPTQFEHKVNHAGVKFLHTTAVKVGDGLVVIQQDITERVKARENLVRLNESLRQKNHALKNINDELNSFAFIASHDLREPIRKIRLYMDQMLHRGEPVIHPDGKLYAAKVLSSAVRMNTLVDGILAFAKINSDSARHHVTLDLDQLVSVVLTDIRQIIAESKGQVFFSSLGNIIGDELQISQLFQHLILNAIKFQKKGNDPRIIIERRNVPGKDIDCTSANPLIEYAAISITDNGIGFNEEYVPKIFLMFQRLHSLSEFPGTGIGLAICKRVMENHKGFVLVKSKDGDGSTFTCYFPNRIRRVVNAEGGGK